MEFKSVASLNEYLQKKINDALEKEVASCVKDEWNISVSEQVYESGNPIVYIRRGLGYGSKGLGDQSQMNSELVGDGVLEVVNNAKPEHYLTCTLSELIEYGYGSKNKWFNVPREVVASAIKEMQESNSHVRALCNGLIERGLKVEGRIFE